MVSLASQGSNPQNQGGQLWAARGWVPRMQGDGSTTEPGGILEVVMLGFDIAGSSTQLCCVVRHTHDLGIGSRKASDLMCWAVVFIKGQANPWSLGPTLIPS